jgi:hypothetical protein
LEARSGDIIEDVMKSAEPFKRGLTHPICLSV